MTTRSNRCELSDLSNEAICMTFQNIHTDLCHFLCLHYEAVLGFALPLNFCKFVILLHQIRVVWQIFIHVEVDDSASCHGLDFSIVVKYQWSLSKECLKDVRNLELSSGCSPAVGFCCIFVPCSFFFSCNINCFIDQTNTFILRFDLEVVTMILTKVNNELTYFRSGIYNLDGVSLDVDYFESSLLDFLLKINHEKSPALGNPIINVTHISKSIRELR